MVMQENEMVITPEARKAMQRRAAKSYLSKAYKIDLRINSKLEQISSLRSLATKATGVLSDMPRAPSGSNSRLEEIVSKIVDLEAEISNDIEKLIDFKKEAMRLIQNVKKPEYKTVLELRHLCFRSWQEISDEMHYSTTHLNTIYNEALLEFAKQL